MCYGVWGAGEDRIVLKKESLSLPPSPKAYPQSNHSCPLSEPPLPLRPLSSSPRGEREKEGN